jgi:hypothetical protein
MKIYLKVLDTKYVSNRFWTEYNSIFKQQMPTWKPGERLKGIESEDEYASFVIYIALIYRAYLKEVVFERRYEKYWLPLSKKFLEYKKNKGYYENTWLMTGQLIDAIEINYNSTKDQIEIGIPDNKYHKIRGVKRKVKLADIARFLEFGTSRENGLLPGIPARPLFRRVREYISKNIGRYYKEFSTMMDLIGE